MKTTRTASKPSITVTVRGLGDEKFVNFNVRYGRVVANGTAPIGKRPTRWRVSDRFRSHPLPVDCSELREMYRLRGRVMAKVLRAIETGRI